MTKEELSLDRTGIQGGTLKQNETIELRACNQESGALLSAGTVAEGSPPEPTATHEKDARHVVAGSTKEQDMAPRKPPISGQSNDAAVSNTRFSVEKEDSTGIPTQSEVVDSSRNARDQDVLGIKKITAKPAPKRNDHITEIRHALGDSSGCSVDAFGTENNDIALKRNICITPLGHDTAEESFTSGGKRDDKREIAGKRTNDAAGNESTQAFPIEGFRADTAAIVTPASLDVPSPNSVKNVLASDELIRLQNEVNSPVLGGAGVTQEMYQTTDGVNKQGCLTHNHVDNDGQVFRTDRGRSISKQGCSNQKPGETIRTKTSSSEILRRSLVQGRPRNDVKYLGGPVASHVKGSHGAHCMDNAGHSSRQRAASSNTGGTVNSMTTELDIGASRRVHLDNAPPFVASQKQCTTSNGLSLPQNSSGLAVVRNHKNPTTAREAHVVRSTLNVRERSGSCDSWKTAKQSITIGDFEPTARMIETTQVGFGLVAGSIRSTTNHVFRKRCHGSSNILFRSLRFLVCFLALTSPPYSFPSAPGPMRGHGKRRSWSRDAFTRNTSLMKEDSGTSDATEIVEGVQDGN
jgi:hypothetical protein